MPWSARFDEPIVLAKGRRLRTLRDAANHILTLPHREAEQKHWQTAMTCLLSAAENGGSTTLAPTAVMQGLHHVGKHAATIRADFGLPDGPCNGRGSLEGTC